MIFNILTYNIQHGLNYRLLKSEEKIRKIEFEPIASLIKQSKADIIGLNEVYNYGETNIDRCEQPKKIANLSNIKNYLFGEAIKVKGTDLYGNAFLTNFDIASYKTIKVPSPKEHTEDKYYEDRVLIEANVKIENKILTCFITHFGLAVGEQEIMLNILKEEIKKIDTPYMLMGDFNMTDDSPIINELKQMMNISIKEPTNTFSSLNPFERIDYIFLSKDIKLIESHVIEYVASDHFPVVATIEL